MSSARKIVANRANARASTGPKTANGRARSAKNALRHALSLLVCSNSALSEEVETLAREIAGCGASLEIQELALRIAEAQIDLRRVRYARHQFLSAQLSIPYYDSHANVRTNMKVISHLLRENAPEMSALCIRIKSCPLVTASPSFARISTTRPEASEMTGTFRETSGVTAPVTCNSGAASCLAALTTGNCSG